MTAVEELYATLKRIQEPKGYFFSRDQEKVFDILAGLLANRTRDCAYREADVREFGSCYCNLYVSPAWNEGKLPAVYVPERRPQDKLNY
jgi:ferredoxin-thioredoxin reductase catalytic chain